MKLYKYWSKGSASVEMDGRAWQLKCHGGSNVSLEDARRRAADIAEKAATAMRRGDWQGRYPYAERPLREELIDALTIHGDRVAAVTRNSYGSLILNTTEALFIDIDYPENSNSATSGGFLSKLFGKASPETVGSDEEILTRIHAVAEEQRGLGLRVYRTANGFRCLATDRTHDSSAAKTLALLERFGCDSLYVTLCKSQECFRARLTPKFWRCDCPRPPSRFPWDDAAQESKYRDWERSYHKQVEAYTTCVFVAEVGNPVVCESVQPIVALHDRFACTSSERLA